VGKTLWLDGFIAGPGDDMSCRLTHTVRVTNLWFRVTK
jgi:hypothetical protein